MVKNVYTRTLAALVASVFLVGGMLGVTPNTYAADADTAETLTSTLVECDTGRFFILLPGDVESDVCPAGLASVAPVSPSTNGVVASLSTSTVSGEVFVVATTTATPLSAEAIESQATGITVTSGTQTVQLTGLTASTNYYLQATQKENGVLSTPQVSVVFTTATSSNPGNAAQAIPGWTTVTTALNATGSGIRIDVGGGNNDHTDLTTLDPGTLTAGSVVNIFYRSTPYNTRLNWIKSGTATDRIIVNGVTDANGQRPEIDCADAQTYDESTWNNYVGGPANGTVVSNLACWVVGRDYSQTNNANTPTQYLTFQNLQMYNAHEDHSAEFNNVDYTYGKGAGPIRIQHGQYIEILSSEFHNNGNGFITSDTETNGCIRLAGNRFEQNGVANSDKEHQIYFQAVGLTPFCNIIEGNFAGEPVANSNGGAIKMRGTDGIIRYNTIIGSARAIDLVAAQGIFPNWIYDNLTAQEILDRYRTAYIYGNQIVIDYDYDGKEYTVAGPFHLSGDTTSGATDNDTWSSGSAQGNVMWRSYGSPSYVYHNSMYIRSWLYRQHVFDFELASAGINDYQLEVVAANNSFHFDRSVAPGSTHVTHAIYTGQVTYEGVNQFHLENIAGASPYESRALVADDPDIVVIGGGTPTVDPAPGDPLYANAKTGAMSTRDLTPGVGSPVLGAASALTGPMTNYPALLQPVSYANGGGAELRTDTADVGAFGD